MTHSSTSYFLLLEFLLPPLNPSSTIYFCWVSQLLPPLSVRIITYIPNPTPLSFHSKVPYFIRSFIIFNSLPFPKSKNIFQFRGYNSSVGCTQTIISLITVVNFTLSEISSRHSRTTYFSIMVFQPLISTTHHTRVYTQILISTVIRYSVLQMYNLYYSMEPSILTKYTK